eukprot:4707885-Pyramimonas_sp.AAC.1
MDISVVKTFAITGAVIVPADAIMNIVVAGAIFVIAANVADVISSSRTSEHQRYAHLHHRLTVTSIGSEDSTIDVAIGDAAAPRIMRRAKTSCGRRGGTFARAVEMASSSSAE